MRSGPARLENPYRTPGRWYRAAFHFHSTNSDGRVPLRRAVAGYVARGYRIVGPSDHDFVSTLPSRLFPRTLLVPTVETAWPHVLLIGTRARGRIRAGSYAATLARARREASFTVFCHPAWSNAGWNDLLRSRGTGAMEVYNHGCEIENGTGIATERWDMVLQTGARLWGFATDDAHFNKPYRDYDGGWIAVRLARLTAPALLGALRRGAFYSSSGPALRSLEVFRGRVTVRSSPVVELRAVADGVGSGLVLFSRSPRTSWRVDYRKWWKQPRRYLRIELKDAAKRTLWCNPLYVKR